MERMFRKVFNKNCEENIYHERYKKIKKPPDEAAQKQKKSYNGS